MLHRPIANVDRASAGIVAAGIGLASHLLAPLGGKGYWHVCRAIGRLALGHKPVEVRLDEDTVFALDPADPYWNRLLGPRFRYEPEIEEVLRQLRDVAYAFVDCGANHGYWSLRVSGRTLGGKPVLAVEPAPTAFALLERNWELNRRRFALRRLAVAAEGGIEVELDEDRHHAAVRIGRGGSRVLTASLDELVAELAPDPAQPVVVKLDVEGIETEVLDAARATLARDLLLIYEDHGKDRTHATSRFVLERLGLRLYRADPAGRVRPVPDLAAVDALKERPTRAYNLFATRPGTTFDTRLAGLG